MSEFTCICCPIRLFQRTTNQINHLHQNNISLTSGSKRNKETRVAPAEILKIKNKNK